MYSGNNGAEGIHGGQAVGGTGADPDELEDQRRMKAWIKAFRKWQEYSTISLHVRRWDWELLTALWPEGATSTSVKASEALADTIRAMPVDDLQQRSRRMTLPNSVEEALKEKMEQYESRTGRKTSRSAVILEAVKALLKTKGFLSRGSP